MPPHPVAKPFRSAGLAAAGRGAGFRRRSRPWRCGLALRAAAALLLGAASLAASPLSAQDDGPAFPPLSGRVVDAANLLDEGAERALSDALAAHEEASSDQVVVATVPSLDGYAIADYANRLGRAWGIGTAENDNGVVLLVAPNEREVRIEVGYGLEGALTDALSSTIIRREILPAFRSGDYPGGIEAGVGAILAAIEGEYSAPVAGGGGTGAAGGPGSARAVDGVLPLIFLALIAVPQLLRRGGARRAANGAFPAGFAGLVGALVSGSVIVGVAIALGLFALIYFGGKGGGGGGGKGRRRRRRVPGVIVGGGGFGGGGFGGGGFGGGGFGGGGGSFGGGGASGGW